MGESLLNIESSFREFLVTNLQNKFNIQNEQELFLYLNLRYEILRGRLIQGASFMSFLLKELFIVEINRHVFFNDIELTYGFTTENSLLNIYDDMCYCLFDRRMYKSGKVINVNEYKKEILDQISNKAKRQIAKYRNSNYRNELIQYFQLCELNRIFDVTLSSVPDLDGVEQQENKESVEVTLAKYLQLENNHTENTKIIAENDFRDYLYNNLYLIEKGLIPIEKEADANEGRIDILAKDKDSNLVIIELKTEIDKRLIWQCLYYPEVIKKRVGEHTKVRMMTICPSYPDYMLDVLKKISDIEMYEYTIKSTDYKIEHVEISKLPD